MTKAKHDSKVKGDEERQLTKELEMTFPASDPPASTQPGSGITGPEVVNNPASIQSAAQDVGRQRPAGAASPQPPGNDRKN
jgi:hypothetical protein